MICPRCGCEYVPNRRGNSRGNLCRECQLAPVVLVHYALCYRCDMMAECRAGIWTAVLPCEPELWFVDEVAGREYVHA